MTERALTFGAVAANYERFRPDYPPALADVVLDYADRPVRTALEIGAGTGKATRLFAARGVAVTATDPDAEMLVELRHHVPSSVTTTVAAFEDLPLETTYDLVFAAAALHWTKSKGRWPRMASLLEGGGTFACFGGQQHLADPELAQAVREARDAVLPDDSIPSPDGTPADAAMQWPGTELQLSDQFEDVRQLIIERRPVISADEYVGHLGTVSAYLHLTATDRADVLLRIRNALPDQVDLWADITVHLARRRRSHQ